MWLFVLVRLVWLVRGLSALLIMSGLYMLSVRV